MAEDGIETLETLGQNLPGSGDLGPAKALQ